MNYLKYMSLFSGIGAFESSLRNLGIPYQLTGYCEIGKAQSKAYSLLHGVDESLNLGDITKIDESKLGQVDFLTYGFPCQKFSIAGTQEGFFHEDGSKTESGLFFDAVRVIKVTKPKVAILENVKNLTSKKFKDEFETVLKTLENLGYNNYWQVLRGDQFGIPQIRPRVYVVSIRKDVDSKLFKFPIPYGCSTRMYDYLESDVDEHYYLSNKMMAYVLDLNEKQAGTKWEGRANNDYINPIIAHTLSVRGIKGQRAGVSNVICTSTTEPTKVSEYKKNLGRRRKNCDLRNLTERESLRLMGFKDWEIDLIINQFNSTELYTFAGNSIIVDVVEEILCMLFDSEGNLMI